MSKKDDENSIFTTQFPYFVWSIFRGLQLQIKFRDVLRVIHVLFFLIFDGDILYQSTQLKATLPILAMWGYPFWVWIPGSKLLMTTSGWSISHKQLRCSTYYIFHSVLCSLFSFFSSRNPKNSVGPCLFSWIGLGQAFGCVDAGGQHLYAVQAGGLALEAKNCLRFGRQQQEKP